jgi:formamidopyrimidine-DNA glycosylase
VPELPEAETIVRTLRPRVEGRRIVSARFLARRVSQDDAASLAGRRVQQVSRYGKQIVWELDRGCLVIKLGMTGALLVDAETGPYTRAEFELETARVLYNDVRQFGSISILDDAPCALGPDPLELRPEDFAARLRSRKTVVKRLLLDQSFVRGIGNIYADESLYRAGVHPQARTERLSIPRAKRLHEVVRAVLEEAIEHRGSSISDYVDAEGARGGFQLRHQVYGRAGQRCIECGAAIRRIVVAQRGTHYCPHCQKR